MIELLKLWMEQVNRRQSLRTMIKDQCFSFQIKVSKKDVLIKIENGLIYLEEYSPAQTLKKRLEGNEELFLSIILGERKLREAVRNNEIRTTFSLRELLLVESLFFLGKPELLGEFITNTY